MRRSVLLLAALTSAPHRPADTWTEVRSAHFVVATNAGEREARSMLDRFEMFRAAFASGFPNFRVDPGLPIVIIAAKNEETLMQLLPEEYETKGAVHHTGMYQGGLDKHYLIILPGNASDNSPFKVLYHEYTHVVMHLNFSRLPVWLNEGLAEYFGYTSVMGNQVVVGQVAPGHIQTLRTTSSMPIDQLLTAEQRFATFDDADRADVFYAQSWALVHYLMLNPAAREQQLLSRFLTSWDKSGDQLGAAREAFGDLDRFGKTLKAYTNRSQFNNGVFKPDLSTVDKNYTVRSLTAGEVLALRADFFVRHNQAQRATTILDQALQLEPNVPFVHEARGIHAYRRNDMVAADSEMVAAARLGSTSFAPHYYHGLLLLRTGGGGPQFASRMQEALASLERSIQINPDFAPSYDALASVHERTPGHQEQAVSAGFQATKLSPSTIQFAVHFASILLNAGREADAKVMADRAEKLAATPAEKSMVDALRARFKAR